MDALCELFRNLGNSLDLDETCATLDRELAGVVAYEGLAVHVARGETLTPAYARGPCQAEFRRNPQCGDNLVGAAAREQRPFADTVSLGGRSVPALAVPAECDGRVLAVISLFRGDPPFSAADRRLLSTVTPKIAAAIGNALRYRRAEELAGREPTTGLLNMGSLFRALDAEVARARRTHSPLAVLDCALGGLEEAERFDAAETAVRARTTMARALGEMCREYDLAAFSGGHFMLVLAGCGARGIEDKCGRVRKMIEEAALAAGLPLGVRIGWAIFPADGRDGDDLLAAAAARLPAGGEHGGA